MPLSKIYWCETQIVCENHEGYTFLRQIYEKIEECIWENSRGGKTFTIFSYFI